MEKLDAQTVGIKGEKANSALIEDAPAEMQAFLLMSSLYLVLHVVDEVEDTYCIVY